MSSSICTVHVDGNVSCTESKKSSFSIINEPISGSERAPASLKRNQVSPIKRRSTSASQSLFSEGDSKEAADQQGWFRVHCSVCSMQ